MRVADGLEARREDFATAIVAETGCTIPWAGFNVDLAASMMREAAAMTTQISGQIVPVDRPGCLVMAVRQPVGVVLGLIPWNGPVILGVRALALPLACGNTVVLKASEVCPATHRLIGSALQDAGLPKGVVNIISHAPADAPRIVEGLIAHPAVRRITFTGSTHVGRMIAATAAKYLKPVLLELGGKSSMIVMDDADLDAAVDAAIFGAFMNQGQICMSTERIVLHQAIADRFLEKFAARAATITARDPRQGGAALGSLVGSRAAERVAELVADALAKGATLAVKGERQGTLMGATVLDRVTPAMRVYGEESFGPVVGLIRVNSAEQAIYVVNDTEYGLVASIYSRDVMHAMAMARRIDTGMCHINGPTIYDEPQMPFGGVKASGYGRFGGQAGVAEFTELRCITIATQPQHYPF
jgi:acyl-CoA reductase-like NAD-dependent aldehyde dehydrogenase